ncbi:hypothetical protein KL931_003547 [Ogataea haglerorum]|nr:hypothetical protein KL931_003547 [Ogataea haglerorum]KAG7801591.1 hypothetical protein KL944_003323 [Ogataea haglerorum]
MQCATCGALHLTTKIFFSLYTNQALMICSISGNPAQEPVLSTKSGHVFEKRLVEEYIAQHGMDPITGDSLTSEDLVAIQVSASEKPLVVRESASTSIPSLLSLFQREWDALALETFELRKQLNQYKKELSLALYKQDAAVRVAASAIKQRDEYKRALEELTIKLGKGEVVEFDTPVGQTNGSQALSEEYASQLLEAHSQLYQQHRSQKYKSPIDESSDMKFTLEEDFKIWDGQKKKTTLLQAEFNPERTKILLAYSENVVVVYDVLEKKISNRFALPKRTKFSYFQWLDENKFVYASTDGIVHIIEGESETKFQLEKKSITSILSHPLLPYLIIAQDDKLYIFDGENKLYESDPFQSKIREMALHQDGLFLGLCLEDNVVQVFNIAKSSVELNVSIDSLGSVENIDKLLFAPNGYSLVIHCSTDSGSKIGIYDLRKDAFQAVLDSPSSPLLAIDKASSYLFNDQTVFRYYKKSKKWSSEVAEIPDLARDVIVNLQIKSLDDHYEVFAILRDGILKRYSLQAGV